MINARTLTAIRLSIITLITVAIYSPTLLAAKADPYSDAPVISVTASRVETEIKDSPVTIDIIDDIELDTVKSVDSVEHLLARIPGNSMSRNLRIPLGGKNYTINLIDGMAVQNFGSGTNGFIDQMNAFDIERVEIIKGPASSLYGSNALGGVINVITRKPPSTPEYRAWIESGNFDRDRGGFSAAGPITDALGYFFDVNYLDFEGSQDRTAKKRKAISGKLVYDFDDNKSFSVRAEHLDTSEETPGSLDDAEYYADWQQAAILDAFTDDQMSSAIFTFDTDLDEHSGLELKYSIRKRETQGMPSYSASGSYSESTSMNHNIVATYNREFDFLKSRVIAGIDLQKSIIDSNGFAARSADSAVDLSKSYDVLAQVRSPFMQYEFSPLERTRVTVGARYDNVTYGSKRKDGTLDESKKFTNVAPKAGITFDLDERNSLWVGYSEGFVVPGTTALFTSTRAIPDPNLKPEEANNIEIGVRGKLMDGQFKYDVALYDTNIENMILTEEIGGTDYYVNAGKVEVKGIETSLSYQPFDSLRFDAAHTYARNKYIEYISGDNDFSGNTMTYSPLHHLNARATWMPRHDLDIELEWDHYSSYYTYSDNDADPRGKYRRPDLFNLRATYDTGSWSVWGHILNLTNKKYARVSYSPATTGWGASPAHRNYRVGSERTLYAGISYNW